MIKAKGLCAAPFIASDDTEKSGKFEGFICMYNVPTADWRKLKIAPGAFAAAIKKPESVRMLWQHDEREPIGVWTKMEERRQGLYAFGEIVVDCERGSDAAALVKNKAIDGISAGWRATKILRPNDDEAGFTTLEGDLKEASLVTFPAFEDARVMKAKEGGDGIDAMTASYLDIAFSSHSVLVRASKHGDPVVRLRTFENALRDTGLLSKTEALRIVSLVKADPRWATLLESLRDVEAETASKAALEAARRDQINKILNNLKGVQ